MMGLRLWSRPAMMCSNYVELARGAIGNLEAIIGLEDNEPNSRVYRKQCEAMVHEFVHIRDSLNSLLGGANDESGAIFKELYRLACEAERVLRRCCGTQWLQAVVLTPNHGPKWSIFETLHGELNWCFNILRGNVDSSTVKRLRDRDRKGMFESDQRSLIEQLKRGARTGPQEERLIAKCLLARLQVLDVTSRRNLGDSIPRSSQQLNCLKFICLLLRDNVATVDLDVLIYRLEGLVLGDRRVIDGGEISVVTTNLNWVGIEVAEKAFTQAPEISRQIRRKWTKEVSIMAKLNHPNVVRFIGCSDGDGGLAIIMECEEKTLQQYIEELRIQDREEEQGMSQTSTEVTRAGPLLDLAVAVDILTQIASGMAYLHCQNVAHLDLKPSNLLITHFTEHNFRRVKITDFDHSIHLTGVAGKISNPFDSNHGTTFYRAPELFYNGNRVCMKAADVCSFGFTCWAILHCNDPKLEDVRPSPPFYYEALVKGIRLGFDDWIPLELRDLIQRCWNTNPDVRPPFSEIYLFLQSYKARLLGSHLPVIPFQNRTEQPRSRIRRLAQKLVPAQR